MSSLNVAAAFWRGGTSRGLLFRSAHLNPYTRATRERILNTAIGAPDPDGRNIDGLGGGVSSLNKVAIYGAPGEGLAGESWEGCGVDWAEEGRRKMENGQDWEWDVVYRFAQVGVKTDDVDWSTTCGNMLSAVALATLTSSFSASTAQSSGSLPPIIPYSKLFNTIRSLVPSSSGSPASPSSMFLSGGEPVQYPLRILNASSPATLLNARVPIDPVTKQVWTGGPGVSIAGVPGTAPGIELDFPIEAGNGGLVTGRPRDEVEVDGVLYPVSILSTSLPNIFLPVSAIPSSITDDPSSLLLASPVALDNHPTLPGLLAAIRETASAKFKVPISASAPKICLIGALPSSASNKYTTTSGTTHSPQEFDFVVRPVSVDNFHRTVPGTTLSALAVGRATPGTTVREVWEEHAKKYGSASEDPAGKSTVWTRIANPAGIAESCVRLGKTGKAESVMMVRTAKEIMRGEVVVPLERLQTA